MWVALLHFDLALLYLTLCLVLLCDAMLSLVFLLCFVLLYFLNLSLSLLCFQFLFRIACLLSPILFALAAMLWFASTASSNCFVLLCNALQCWSWFVFVSNCSILLREIPFLTIKTFPTKNVCSFSSNQNSHQIWIETKTSKVAGTQIWLVKSWTHSTFVASFDVSYSCIPLPSTITYLIFSWFESI